MGDTGEAFKEFNEMKAEHREKVEPKRFYFANRLLDENGFIWKEENDCIKFLLKHGTVTFWPYTGWFQGQKPYGKIKGRGVLNLIKELKNVRLLA